MQATGRLHQTGPAGEEPAVGETGRRPPGSPGRAAPGSFSPLLTGLAFEKPTCVAREGGG